MSAAWLHMGVFIRKRQTCVPAVSGAQVFFAERSQTYELELYLLLQ